jgi:hypothetical protein
MCEIAASAFGLLATIYLGSWFGFIFDPAGIALGALVVRCRILSGRLI